MPICSACRRPGCGSSRCMGRGAGRTWRISASPGRSWPASRSRSTTAGRLRRDFTYIDDIVAGVVGCLDRPPEDAAAGAGAEHRQSPQRGGAATLVALLEQALGRQAIVRAAPRPPADVEETFASVDAIGGADRVCAAHVAGGGNSAVCERGSGVARRLTWRIGPAKTRLTCAGGRAYIALPPRRTVCSCLSGRRLG